MHNRISPNRFKNFSLPDWTNHQQFVLLILLVQAGQSSTLFWFLSSPPLTLALAAALAKQSLERQVSHIHHIDYWNKHPDACYSGVSCVQIYTHIHKYIKIHICIYTYIHIYIFTYIHINIYVLHIYNIHIYIYTYTHTYTHTYTYLHIYTYTLKIYIQIYIYTYMHVYV